MTSDEFTREEQQRAEALYAALRGGHAQGTDAGKNFPREEAELAAALMEASSRIHVDPEFEKALEHRLAPGTRRSRRANPGKAAGRRLNFTAIGRPLVWAALAGLLLFGLVWTFQNALPRQSPAAGTPIAATGTVSAVDPTLPATATSTPLVTATSQPSLHLFPSPWISGGEGSGIALNAQLPSSPQMANVYTQQAQEALTVDNARQVAAQLGIEGNVYEVNHGGPDVSGYLVTDGVQQVVFTSSPMHFNYQPALRPGSIGAGEYPPAEQLIASAEQFLKSRGLLEFEYQAKTSAVPSGVVEFIPMLNGVPLDSSAIGQGIQVSFNPVGEIISISYDRSQAQTEGEYPIISAEEAWAKLTLPDMVYGIELYDSFSFSLPGQVWQHDYPSGQRVELFRPVTVFQPAEPGGQPLILIDGFLAEGKLDGLAEAAQNNPLMQLWGTLRTGDGGQQILNVEGWQVSPFPIQMYSGQIVREGEQAYLQTVDQKLLLADVPADVPQGVELTVQGALVENGASELVWSIISSGIGGGGGGGGGGMGFLSLNLDGPPAPPPTAYPSPTPMSAPMERAEGALGNIFITIREFQDGTRITEAYASLDPSNAWPDGIAAQVEGPGLDGIEAYHQLPVKLWGSFRKDPYQDRLLMDVERIEPVYPGLKGQVWSGTAELVTIDGNEVALFTAAEDGTVYVLKSTVDNTDRAEHVPWANGDTVVVEGLAIPGETWGEYPVINDLVVIPGSGIPQEWIKHPELYQPQRLTPEVYLDQGEPGGPTIAAIDSVELVYQPTSPMDMGDGTSQPTYLQPAWRFSGRYSDGRTFTFLVQALQPQYLK